MQSRQQTKHVEAVLPYNEGRAATGGLPVCYCKLNNAELHRSKFKVQDSDSNELTGIQSSPFQIIKFKKLVSMVELLINFSL